MTRVTSALYVVILSTVSGNTKPCAAAIAVVSPDARGRRPFSPPPTGRGRPKPPVPCRAANDNYYQLLYSLSHHYTRWARRPAVWNKYPGRVMVILYAVAAQDDFDSRKCFYALWSAMLPCLIKITSSTEYNIIVIPDEKISLTNTFRLELSCDTLYVRFIDFYTHSCACGGGPVVISCATHLLCL